MQTNIYIFAECAKELHLILLIMLLKIDDKNYSVISYV